MARLAGGDKLAGIVTLLLKGEGLVEYLRQQGVRCEMSARVLEDAGLASLQIAPAVAPGVEAAIAAPRNALQLATV